MIILAQPGITLSMKGLPLLRLFWVFSTTADYCGSYWQRNVPLITSCTLQKCDPDHHSGRQQDVAVWLLKFASCLCCRAIQACHCIWHGVLHVPSMYLNAILGVHVWTAWWLPCLNLWQVKGDLQKCCAKDSLCKKRAPFWILCQSPSTADWLSWVESLLLSLMKRLFWMCWDFSPKLTYHLPTTRRPLTIVNSMN